MNKKKSQKNTKPVGDAGRVNKQPVKSTTTGSSRQAGKGGSQKAAQKAAQKSEAMVERSKQTGSKRKAAEAVEEEVEERMITKALSSIVFRSLYIRGEANGFYRPRHSQNTHA